MDTISHNTNPTVISAELADWSRETPQQFWDQALPILASKGAFLGCLLCNFLVIRHHFWGAVTDADIPLDCRIGSGLLIPHPNGIVIHPGARIGVNCLILQQVTIGTRETEGFPEIGGHADIGAGAKILGQVTIGDHAKIGANAVVTRNIAARTKAIGLG
jgi:serine O-acetyltransferase